MAVALVANIGAGSTDSNGFTTSTISTLGANFIVLGSTVFNASSDISDSESNVWNVLSPQYWGGGLVDAVIWFAINPTVSATHSFTSTGTTIYPALCVAAFSGMETGVTVFDTEIGETAPFSGGPDAFQGGALTPSTAGDLLISVIGWGSGTGWSIDLSYAITDEIPLVGGQCDGLALAYLITSSTASKNPTWIKTGTGNAAVCNASFRQAAAAGGQPMMRRWGGTPYVGGQGINSTGSDSGKMWGRSRRSGLAIPRWLADEQERAA